MPTATYGSSSNCSCSTMQTAGKRTKEDFQPIHDGRVQKQHRWLPEAFLWSVFESLAVSALLLEHGETGSNPLQDWNPIYHLDYKTSNVLLGIPSKDRYRGYPLAKLTDFGLSWIPDRHKVLQPDEQPDYRGTVYNASPEQISHVYIPEAQRRLINAKVNIWGVGIVMWSLIEHEEGDHRLAFDTRYDPINDHDHTVLEPTFRGPAQAKYSKVLLDLISATTRYRPEDRLEARELLRRIWRNTGGSGGADYAGGMRGAAKDSNNWQAEDVDMSTFLRNDKFAMSAKEPSGAGANDPTPNGMDKESFRMPPKFGIGVPVEDEVIGGGPWPGYPPPPVRVPRNCAHDPMKHDKIYCCHACCKRGLPVYVGRGSTALVQEAKEYRRRSSERARLERDIRMAAARLAAAPPRRNPPRAARPPRI